MRSRNRGSLRPRDSKAREESKTPGGSPVWGHLVRPNDWPAWRASGQKVSAIQFRVETTYKPLDHRRRRGTSLRFAPASRRSLPARSRDALPLGARDRVAAPSDRRPAMVARQVLSRTAPAMGGRHAVPFRYFLRRFGHPRHVVGASRCRAGWSGASRATGRRSMQRRLLRRIATRASRWPSASRTCLAE